MATIETSYGTDDPMLEMFKKHDAEILGVPYLGPGWSWWEQE